ncbi:peptidase M24 [Oceanobacillus picturae]|uniref:Peptidase M24 n=1 Tax=Oceanobacillus picturae TaxID=171693 RepID=A0A0U9HB49_9BACI|nr:hypothetical protein [Oceanobacillus picturae]GAQ18513.1 peptidase M24 [Oceanobacillus picturae]
MKKRFNIIVVSVIASIAVIVLIASPGEGSKDKKVHAEEKLIITEMSYEKWVWHRKKNGYPADLTRDEYYGN